MTVVVGYVPKPEGEAALERAIAEAQLRSQDLVVVNSSSGDAYADPTWATDEQLASVQERLQAAGVPYELVHTHGQGARRPRRRGRRQGPRPAARHRPAPTQQRRQAPARQHRLHHPHARPLPGARREGAGGEPRTDR